MIITRLPMLLTASVSALLTLAGLAAPTCRPTATETFTTSAPLVLTAALDDQGVTPGTTSYLIRAISQAESQGAECLVIVLDTPRRDTVNRRLSHSTIDSFSTGASDHAANRDLDPQSGP